MYRQSRSNEKYCYRWTLYVTYQSDLSTHKVKHIITLEVYVVYNKHTATATPGTTITRHEFTMQVPAAHTTLVRDSKQAMATTSTLLRYTIVVAPDAASQGSSSVTLQVANCLCTLDRVEGEIKVGKAGLP